MKLSINTKIINKNETGQRSQAVGFKSVDISTKELAEHVALGHAFSFQFKENYRKSENFLCSDIIAADMDEGMSLEEAMNDPFILANACLLYTTPSHTPEDHRFRLVFRLPHTVTDIEHLKKLQRGLLRKFPTADKSVKDGARQFYGSRGCHYEIFANVLSDEIFDHLIQLGNEPINLPDRQGVIGSKSGFRSEAKLYDDSQIRNAKGEWVRLSEMAGSKPVYCPFHNDRSPSAFSTISRSGSMGVHCSTCQVTFWIKRKEPEPYDFQVFDKLVRKEVSNFVPTEIMDETNSVVVFETSDPNVLVTEKHLSRLPLHDGITLIKSPKGTGKTTYLEHLVGEYKKLRKSVLLVGHRRSLLVSLSSSLGLECYLDKKNLIRFSPNRMPKYFAISVDSMATMLKPNIHKFDVVLIDESEQVFSHLIADTLKIESQRKCYLLLQHYIHTAKAVVALDADLNEITLHAIHRFGTRNPLIDRRLVLNEYIFPKKTIEIYGSDKKIVGEIINSIRRDERIFICSNVKKKIDGLVEMIKHNFGHDFPLFWVTSENSNTQEVSNFLTSIKTEILKYKVVLVSPAMGTGIDITFEGDETNVDGVYGLFESRINTHFDIDQQISRVRHPGYVRVWVSQETFNYETEVDPIKQEIAESGLIPEVLTGYSLTGIPEFNWNDPYLTLYSTILAAQRASKNDLRKNFIDLRTYNGWDIRYIDRDDGAIIEGSALAKEGEELRQESRKRRLMLAEVIDSYLVDDLKKKSDRGTPLGRNARTSRHPPGVDVCAGQRTG